MNTKQELRALGENIVYLRAVDVADLPDDVRAEAAEVATDTLFAVHNTEGEQVALVASADVASHLAKVNELQLVTLQ
jgi:hypothetical protein